MSSTTDTVDWSFIDSFGSLLVTLAVAAATLSMLGAGLHLLDRRFSFSLVRAVHQSWTWIAILVISVPWLATGLIRQVRFGDSRQTKDRRITAGEAESRPDQVLLNGSRPESASPARRSQEGRG